MRIRSRHSLAMIPVVAASLLGPVAVPGAAAPAADKKTPATGRVHYRMNSPIVSGTMVMTWINHGKKFRQDMKLSVGQQGKQTTINSWTLTDGGYLYTYQPQMGQQVMRMKMPKSMAGGTFGLPSPGTAGSGKVVGKGTVLGRPCQVHLVGAGGKSGQAKVWIWKGMPLKMEANGPQGQGMSLIATRVETAPKIAMGDFKVPAGYQVRDVQAPTGAPPAGPR
jgi:hypothetical protein